MNADRGKPGKEGFENTVLYADCVSQALKVCDVEAEVYQLTEGLGLYRVLVTCGHEPWTNRGHIGEVGFLLCKECGGYGMLKMHPEMHRFPITAPKHRTPDYCLRCNHRRHPLSLNARCGHCGRLGDGVTVYVD